MALSNAVSPSQVARTVGIETLFKNLRGGVVLLPQRLAVMAQGAEAATFLLDKRQIFSGLEAAQIYGFGSPLHLAIRELLPANNDGVGTIPVTAYPLDSGTTASVGDITPSVGPQTAEETYSVRVNEIPSELIVVPQGTAFAATIPLFIAGINANNDMPLIASDGTGKVDLIAKWKGESGDDLHIEIEGVVSGIVYVITQPTGGAGNPDVQDALDKVADIWETMFLNCLNVSDTTTLDKYATFGEGRWNPLVKKPMMSFVGSAEADVTTAVAIPDARKTDRTNCQLVAPGSNELPFVVAARELARIVVIANNNPPTDYAGQLADGIVPGSDTQQWTRTQRDFAVKSGSSTIEILDGVIELSDTITMYHPSGDPTPAWRFVADVVKEMNVVFNLRLIFEALDWKGKILIPNGQATTNPNARRPSAAVAAIAKMFDSLGLEAIISDPQSAKKSIQAQISGTNPKRLDITETHQISGNTNIISITNNFGFFFGTQTAI